MPRTRPALASSVSWVVVTMVTDDQGNLRASKSYFADKQEARQRYNEAVLSRYEGQRRSVVLQFESNRREHPPEEIERADD